MISHASPARLLVIALLMGTVAVGLMLVLLHSPVVPAVAGGLVFGALFLFIATGIGGDPEAADAAWRAEAGDLASHPPSPTLPASSEGAPAIDGEPVTVTAGEPLSVAEPETVAEPVTVADR